MIISHSRKFVFIKTRKTAGSSVQKVLWTFCDPKQDECTGDDFPGDPHVRAVIARGSLGEKIWCDYFTFSIERNPWDKVVSLFWWVKVVYNMPDNFRDWALRSGENMLKGRIHRDYYFNTDWLHYTNKSKRIVNYVMFYEGLDAHFKHVCEVKLGIPYDDIPDLPRLKNKTNPRNKPYQAYYDDETKGLVEEIFKQEIGMFGYKFEPPGYLSEEEKHGTKSGE